MSTQLTRLLMAFQIAVFEEGEAEILRSKLSPNRLRIRREKVAVAKANLVSAIEELEREFYGGITK